MMTEIIDFFKISDFKGVINFDLDITKEEEMQAIETYLKRINILFPANEYKKMEQADYVKFMKYLQTHPVDTANRYIIE